MHNASPPLPEIATSNQERSALETKALEFQQAMDRYHRTTLYKKIGIITAISIVSLQFISLVQWYCACHTQTLHALNLILCFLFTYFFTDFAQRSRRNLLVF